MESDQKSELHSHCKTCCKMNCTVPPALPDSCSQMTCELQCGFRFHSCKLKEHDMVCPERRVPCINIGNGCPVVLPRQQLGEHLERCPASVVCCTMEWNRWPVSQCRLRVPLKLANLQKDKDEQLDVALALRDQRMLTRAKQAPRTTQHVLRSQLTEHFPAVPINIRHMENLNPLKSVDPENELPLPDDEEDCREQAVDQPEETYGMSTEPQVLQLLNASKRASETLAAALSLVTEGIPSNCDNHIDLCDTSVDNTPSCDANCDNDNNADASNANNVQRKSDETYDDINELCNVDKVTLQDDEKASVESNVLHSQGHKNRAASHIRCALCPGGSGPAPSYQLPTVGGVLIRGPEPVPDFPSHQDVLDLDLNLEQITRYQAKPNSMYTFLCAQSFRRDEYSWHFVSVHSEIQGGLSGWLEHRCPLAVYGCTFSQRRLHPGAAGSKLVYSPLLESFGVRPAPHLCEEECPPCITKDEIGNLSLDKSNENTISHAKESDSCTAASESADQAGCEPIEKEDIDKHKSLLVLPYEVLRHVAKFLDGYSLCNLSLTCSLLRDVCCSLLENRGIVIQEWEPVQKDGKKCWEITYKRWLFSTAFSPIRHWGFDDHDCHMSDHLKQCPFNCRDDPLPHPVPLPVRHQDSEPVHPDVSRVLAKMYPDVDVDALMDDLTKEIFSWRSASDDAANNFVPVEPETFEGGLEKLVLPQKDFNVWARGENADK